jgi:hypothetical protein
VLGKDWHSGWIEADCEKAEPASNMQASSAKHAFAANRKKPKVGEDDRIN